MVIIREEPVFLIAVSGLLFGLSLFNEAMLEKLQYLIIILFLVGKIMQTLNYPII